MKEISTWLVNKLERYLPSQPGMKEMLEYGIQLALYTITSTIGLLLISLFMGMFVQGLIIIFVFYVNQTVGGGFHADSHRKCFFTMSTGVVLGNVICKYFSLQCALFVLGAGSLGILLCFPVVLHSRKAFLKNRIPTYIKCSRICSILEIITGGILFQLWPTIFNAYVIGLFFSAVSRIYASACSTSLPH